MEFHTSGLHHLALRVSNYERSKHFYLNTLGFKQIVEKPELCIFLVGNMPIAIRGPENKTADDDRFDPFRVGLDHMAIACENKKDLENIAEALNREKVENTGIKHDGLLDKDYIAFKDPDRISWEYYMV